ncbi:DUF5133 domain-containing protein [Streptomyces longwoodensis]|uniref:DUF5133 domain-containing protein n=1 Tax=Streptomyces longwoodensis TaxID=68231 RepID=UPI002ED4A379|nr:DUF5133 domain-containing protein [Streptomyces longwoodensis]
MLMPHPAVLRRLVDEYQALTKTAGVAGAEPATRSTREQDLAYTLCVSTGTRDVVDALETARRWLAASAVPPPEQTGPGTHVLV